MSAPAIIGELIELRAKLIEADINPRSLRPFGIDKAEAIAAWKYGTGDDVFFEVGSRLEIMGVKVVVLADRKSECLF